MWEGAVLAVLYAWAEWVLNDAPPVAIWRWWQGRRTRAQEETENLRRAIAAMRESDWTVGDYMALTAPEHTSNTPHAQTFNGADVFIPFR